MKRPITPRWSVRARSGLLEHNDRDGVLSNKVAEEEKGSIIDKHTENEGER